MSRYIGLLVVLLFIIVPFSSSSALAISPGCRAATQADMKARLDRGISPVDQQVCPGDELYLGIGEDFDKWYAQLKTQSPCNKNTCTLSCRTRNTGAMVCSSVAGQWNSIGCHPNNNTAIFPSAAYGFAAHISLLRNYCGKQGRCTIAQIQQKWSTANQAAYAAFVSRMSGVPQNQVFDPNDIDLVARLALSMSCFEAGAMPYDVNELKQGISMASGGPKLPVPANVGQLLQESLTGSYAPYANPGTWAPTQFMGQPFMQPQVGYGTNSPQPTSIATQNPNQTAQPVNTVNPTTGTYSPNSSIPVPGANPASNIVVWPHVLTRGQTAMVYWTSVNMAKDSCQVQFQNQQFAKSNEGTKPFTTTSFDPGTLTFTLQCSDANGQQRQVSDSAILQ